MTSLCRMRSKRLWPSFHAPKLFRRIYQNLCRLAAHPSQGRIGGVPEPYTVFRDVLADRVALILV
jgi:hypothetical protein